MNCRNLAEQCRDCDKCAFAGPALVLGEATRIGRSDERAWARPQLAQGNDQMKFEGTAAVVTGAASGLGEATARELAKRGAKVAVFDRDAARGEQVAADIGGIFCEVDVTSDEKVAGAFAKARDAHGQERIL